MLLTPWTRSNTSCQKFLDGLHHLTEQSAVVEKGPQDKYQSSGIRAHCGDHGICTRVHNMITWYVHVYMYLSGTILY